MFQVQMYERWSDVTSCFRSKANTCSHSEPCDDIISELRSPTTIQLFHFFPKFWAEFQNRTSSKWTFVSKLGRLNLRGPTDSLTLVQVCSVLTLKTRFCFRFFFDVLVSQSTCQIVIYRSNRSLCWFWIIYTTTWRIWKCVCETRSCDCRNT